jgi:hypothetical protein
MFLNDGSPGDLSCSRVNVHQILWVFVQLEFAYVVDAKITATHRLVVLNIGATSDSGCVADRGGSKEPGDFA